MRKRATENTDSDTVKRLAAMTWEERQALRRKIIILFEKGERRALRLRLKGEMAPHKRFKSDPRAEAAIELYAFKSFQAQDISCLFNKARMNEAVKEVKLGM